MDCEPPKPCNPPLKNEEDRTIPGWVTLYFMIPSLLPTMEKRSKGGLLRDGRPGMGSALNPGRSLPSRAERLLEESGT